MNPEDAPPGVNPLEASAARLYDYYLGGSTNFPVDAEAGENLRKGLPDLYDAAWANRGFHQRAARWMAKEHGIRQFLDLGSGLPTQGNTHQAVRQVIPDARVVYVDVDEMVRAMSGGLLDDDKHTQLIIKDMREPQLVLTDPGLHAMIDLSEPVGLLMTAVLHFVADTSDPWGLVRQYTDALAPGSFLALSHATADKLPPRSVEAMNAVYENANTRIYLRSKSQIGRFFEGLEYPDIEPGVTYVGVWGAEDKDVADSDGSRVLYCGVGRRG